MGPNRKEWVILWAEIPERGGVDSCPEVLRISSVSWASGADVARLECFLSSTVKCRKDTPSCCLGRRRRGRAGFREFKSAGALCA